MDNDAINFIKRERDYLFKWKSTNGLATRISKVPLVICGPILRRVQPDAVTVWVALKESRDVVLHVYTDTDSHQEIMTGACQTQKIGSNLHVVAVTAVGILSSHNLLENSTYFYDLDFGNGDRLDTLGVLSFDLDQGTRRKLFAYGNYQLPSFTLMPKNASKLRIVHASCRKPHGEGNDALAALDTLIATSIDQNVSLPEGDRGRPHLLLLTGDQIYADDVADMMLILLDDAADVLLGWRQGEELPGFPSPTYVSDLLPGNRANTMTMVAGFTSGIPDPVKCKSHLVGFGEFCAMYLLAWSDVLWPKEIPVYYDLYTGDNRSAYSVTSRVSDENDALAQFRHTLPLVRRALANVPTYMILDDHEITDDWYINREWCNRVFGLPPKRAPSELGLRVIQNGLAAYAIFQAWGNTPDQFSLDQGPGKRLLDAIAKWDGTLKSPSLSDIKTAVGLPTSGPPATSDRGSCLPTPPGAITWYYSISYPGYSYEILVLDCRTCREYPPSPPAAAPALLSSQAFQLQIKNPTPNQTTAGEISISIVVAQTPVIGIPWVERKQREATTDRESWDIDAEAWGLNKNCFQTMLSSLVMRRKYVVILSGDVHYGFTARVGYWASHPFGEQLAQQPWIGSIAQLVASSLKNQTSSWLPGKYTDEMHIHGWDPYPYPGFCGRWDNPETWVGWTSPPESSDIVLGKKFKRYEPLLFKTSPSLLNLTDRPVDCRIYAKEDWRYLIQFHKGDKTGLTTVVTPVTQPSAGDKDSQLKFDKEVSSERKKALAGEEGTKVVGVNNIGEVYFDPDQDGTWTVHQDLWWEITKDGLALVKTCFTVPLSVNLVDWSLFPPQEWESRQ